MVKQKSVDNDFRKSIIETRMLKGDLIMANKKCFFENEYFFFGTQGFFFSAESFCCE